MASNPSRKLPALTSQIAPDLRRFLERVREIIFDLDGTAQQQSSEITNISRAINSSATGSAAQSSTVAAASSPAAPPAPTGVTTQGQEASILVSWDEALYAGHGFTEVWASATDDRSAATLVSASAGNQFEHAVGSEVTRYYWLRFISATGVQGLFSESVSGTAGSTGLVVETPSEPDWDNISGIFTSVLLSWEAPTYAGHAYTNVYAGTTTVFASASFIGSSTGSSFNYKPPSADRTTLLYYWLRHVNISEEVGPVSTRQSYQLGDADTDFISALRADFGTIQADEITSSTAFFGDVTVGPGGTNSIASDSYRNNPATGWLIDGAGDAVFNSVTIRNLDRGGFLTWGTSASVDTEFTVPVSDSFQYITTASIPVAETGTYLVILTGTGYAYGAAPNRHLSDPTNIKDTPKGWLAIKPVFQINGVTELEPEAQQAGGFFYPSVIGEADGSGGAVFEVYTTGALGGVGSFIFPVIISEVQGGDQIQAVIEARTNLNANITTGGGVIETVNISVNKI